MEFEIGIRNWNLDIDFENRIRNWNSEFWTEIVLGGGNKFLGQKKCCPEKKLGRKFFGVRTKECGPKFFGGAKKNFGPKKLVVPKK